jgi:hypothetical protein
LLDVLGLQEGRERLKVANTDVDFDLLQVVVADNNGHVVTKDRIAEHRTCLGRLRDSLGFIFRHVSSNLLVQFKEEVEQLRAHLRRDLRESANSDVAPCLLDLVAARQRFVEQERELKRKWPLKALRVVLRQPFENRDRVTHFQFLHALALHVREMHGGQWVIRVAMGLVRYVALDMSWNYAVLRQCGVIGVSVDLVVHPLAEVLAAKAMQQDLRLDKRVNQAWLRARKLRYEVGE